MDVEHIFKTEIEREIHGHEVFLSFNSDEGALIFHEWWEMKGRDEFERWAADNG